MPCSTYGYCEIVRRSLFAAPLAMLLAAITLSGCGNSGSPKTIQNNPMSPNNFLACTNINVVFLSEAASTAIAHTDALNAIAFGEKAENPAVRKAAEDLQTQANVSNQAGVNKAILAFTLACHKMGIGPGDNTGG